MELLFKCRDLEILSDRGFFYFIGSFEIDFENIFDFYFEYRCMIKVEMFI